MVPLKLCSYLRDACVCDVLYVPFMCFLFDCILYVCKNVDVSLLHYSQRTTIY